MSTINPDLGRKRGPRFKVSRADAAKIKSAYEAGRSTVEEVASQFGVTKQTIYNVISRLRSEARLGMDPRWK